MRVPIGKNLILILGILRRSRAEDKLHGNYSEICPLHFSDKNVNGTFVLRWRGPLGHVQEENG